MTNSEPSRSKRSTPLALKIGFGLWAISLLWWFLYYAGWIGPFRLLDLKFSCISGATEECLFYQTRLATTSVPTYWPIFWWVGMVCNIVGIYQSYQARKAAP